MRTARRPRRKRYVVAYVTKSGEYQSIDVIAHSEESACDVVARRRGDPVSVRPYRKGERFQVPADGGWRLIESALYDAAAELGIEFPVALKQTGHKGDRMGRHKADKTASGQPYHNITIKNFLTAEDAGRTLWHELRHAQQCEKLAAETGTEFGTPEFIAAWRDVYRDGTTYRAKRWEVEARATEPNNDRLPLARRA